MTQQVVIDEIRRLRDALAAAEDRAAVLTEALKVILTADPTSSHKTDQIPQWWINVCEVVHAALAATKEDG